MPGRVQCLTNSGETGAHRSGACQFRHAMGLHGIAARLVELALEIFLRDLCVAQGHTDVLVAQHAHERREADAEAKHLSRKGVTELVRLDGHRTAGRQGGLFQGGAQSLIHEQGWMTGEGRPFQEQVFLQHRDDFGGQRQQTRAATLAQHAELGGGGIEVVQLERQNFTTAQSIEHHTTHDGQIAESVKAAPELSDLLGRKGLHETALLLEPQAAGDDAARPAVAERGSLGIDALEVNLAGGPVPAVVMAIEALDDDEAAIDGLGRRRRWLVGLVADIIRQRRLRR